MKAAILGAGYIAHAHAAAYASIPGVELSLIADPREGEATRLAKLHGAKAVASADAVWESDVDLVSVCTPTPTHASLSVAALRAGKHVLCEKPIAGSLADATIMLEAAQAAYRQGVRFMVGHVSRFEPDHLAAKAVIDRGEIGRLRMASQSITGPFPDWSSGGWFADPVQSGGPIVDLAIHSFDYLAWLFGTRPTRISAVGVARQVALPTYALCTVRFEGGGLALVEVSWAHPRAGGLAVRTELTGTEGRIAWAYEDIAALRVIEEPSAVRNMLMLGSNSFVSQISSFLTSIRNGTPVPVSGEAALTALEIALAANESLHTGEPVDLVPVRLESTSEQDHSDEPEAHR